MVLADTSVWISHIRSGEPDLVRLLEAGLVLMHPFVLGELACGNLSNREDTLADLATLPTAARASDKEVMVLIERHRLWGLGIGWVDAHLLASALITPCRLWTLDRRLAEAGVRLGVG